MPFAKSQRRSGQRHINGFGSQGSIARCLCQGTLAFVEQRFKTRARFIDELPDAGPLFGRDRTHAAQQAGSSPFLPSSARRASSICASDDAALSAPWQRSSSWRICSSIKVSGLSAFFA
jgi:hypothetical protein